ncbi:hypothetical protein D049_3853B, partial [Vibrio parahaemolyticus VPTS-2010]
KLESSFILRVINKFR